MELLAFNKDLYLGIVFIHIFAAIIWVGGAFTFQLRIAQLRKANDTAGFLQLGQDAERMGQRVFMPASIVVLLAGIAMVWYGPYSLSCGSRWRSSGSCSHRWSVRCTWGPKGASSRGSRRNAASRTPTWSPLATGSSWSRASTTWCWC